MKRTLWTVATTGLLAICMTTCGGGASKDYATAFCERLQGCNDLSMVDGATTVSECKDSSNQHLNAMSSSQRAAFDQGIDECLALSDCTSLEGCARAAVLCFRLQGCSALSLVANSTTIAECVAYANQQLSALDSSQRSAAALALNACGKLSDCTSLGACMVASFPH